MFRLGKNEFFLTFTIVIRRRKKAIFVFKIFELA